MKTHLLILLPTLTSLSALASSTTPRAKCAERPHTHHNITVNKPATCVVAKLFEPEAFCLMDADGDDIAGAPFAVLPGTAAKFAMGYNDKADFNMQFALTCVSSDNASAQSPKVIATIGADGPAQAHISITELYGARGSWKPVPGGEDFDLQF